MRDATTGAELAQRERTERERVILSLARENRELRETNDQLHNDVNRYRRLLGQAPLVRRP